MKVHWRRCTFFMGHFCVLLLKLFEMMVFCLNFAVKLKTEFFYGEN